jgi:hypothetical protein
MNLLRILGILAIGLIPLSSVPQASGKTPQPLVMLYVRDPERMVIGSDSPVFALYDNGLVIYVSGEKRPEEAFLAKLFSPPELRELLTTIDPERRLAGLDGKTIEASMAQDQPTNRICYWINGKLRAVSVYGRLRESAPEREQVPKPFLEVFDILRQFRTKGAKPWLPPLIEVLIWPFDNSQLKPEPWPKEWPGLDDPATRKRGDRGYSLFLESRHFSDFLNLGRNMRSGQALLIGDKKWAVSYRIPFPGGF